MTLNIILLTWSVVISTAYLIYIRRFGKLNSISAYAGPLTERNQQFLTYAFIWLGLSFPLGYIADHWLTSIAAILLCLDGLYTGYNPTHLKGKAQDIIHIIGVQGAILLFVVGTFFINWWLALILFVIFAIPCVLMYAKKTRRHTYWIEILVIAWIMIFLLIEKIILL